MPTSDKQPSERQRVRTITERHAPRGQSAWFYIVVFVTAALVVNVIFGDRGVLAMLRAEREYEETQSDLARIQQDNAKLRERVRRLTEDPATIEELARKELGLIKPGETVFILKDVPPAKGK